MSQGGNKHHRSACMCFACRAQQAGPKKGEVLSVRLDPETRRKLQKLMAFYNQTKATAIKEAIDSMYSRVA